MRFTDFPPRRRAVLLSAIIAVGCVAILLARRTSARREVGSRGTRRPGPGPTTQSTVPRTPADRDLGTPGRNLDQRLDEAIEESFPASDPISLRIE
ncbi:MAG TPA: hypothetical protein VMY76_14000 [Gemmatimonadales bacterium]|nr:hypothetical protein [Gemmatimonadales bacterium]